MVGMPTYRTEDRIAVRAEDRTALRPAPADAEPSWRETALCAQTGPELFFPEPGSSTREAKSLCGMCEIREACLEYALTHDERFGVWGGLSEQERYALRRRRADRR
ncbi:WhiB family transcriptional regulator [Streptomyces sp. Act-28]